MLERVNFFNIILGAILEGRGSIFEEFGLLWGGKKPSIFWKIEIWRPLWGQLRLGLVILSNFEVFWKMLDRFLLDLWLKLYVVLLYSWYIFWLIGKSNGCWNMGNYCWTKTHFSIGNTCLKHLTWRNLTSMIRATSSRSYRETQIQRDRSVQRHMRPNEWLRDDFGFELV